MSLCKLVVIDYQNWLEGKPFELEGDGWGSYDVAKWKMFVEEDIGKGVIKNWWYKFNNKKFLSFLAEYMEGRE